MAFASFRSVFFHRTANHLELPRRNNHDARHVILRLFAKPPAVADGFQRSLVARPQYFNEPLQAAL